MSSNSSTEFPFEHVSNIFVVIMVGMMLVAFVLLMGVFLLLKERYYDYYHRRESFFKNMLPEYSHAVFAKPSWLGWLCECLLWKSENIYKSLGLDGFVTIRVVRTLLFMVVGASLWCLIVLLPVHCLDFTHNASIYIMMRTSLSSIPDRSPWLWAHLVSVYIISLYICGWLYYTWREVCHYRQKYFSQNPLLTRTLLICELDDKKKIGELEAMLQEKLRAIERNENFQIYILRDVCRMQTLLEAYDFELKLYSATEENIQNTLNNSSRSALYSEPNSEDESSKRVKKAWDDVCSSVAVTEEGKLPAAIVVCPTGAGFQALRTTCFTIDQVDCPVTRLPEPTALIWKNIQLSKNFRKVNKSMVWFMTSMTIMFWALPIAVVAAVAKSVPMLDSFLPQIRNCELLLKFIHFFSYTLLPLIAIQGLILCLRQIFTRMSYLEGHTSHQKAEFSIFTKMSLFNAVDTFFIFSVSASVFDRMQLIVEVPLQFISEAASSMPLQANFFILYIAFQAFIVIPWYFLKGSSFFFLLMSQIKYLCANLFRGHTHLYRFPKDTSPTTPYYMEKLSYAMLIFGIGLTLTLMSPLISIVWVIYFVLFYYLTAFDEENNNMNSFSYLGEFWPLVSHIIVGYTIFMQIIMCGMFAAKSYMALSLATIPCSVLTGLASRAFARHFGPRYKFPTNETRERTVDPSPDEILAYLKWYHPEYLIPQLYKPSESVILNYLKEKQERHIKCNTPQRQVGCMEMTSLRESSN